MNLQKAGWIAVALEVILLLVWIRSVYFVRGGTDAAGKGTAIVFLIALGIWILVGVILMLLNRKWSTILTLIMAAIPLLIVVIGLIRYYGSGRSNY